MEDKSVRMWRANHKVRERVNAVWIEPDDKPDFKPFCRLCGVYHIYLKNRGFECPKCGDEYVDNTSNDGQLQNKYGTEPLIANVKLKKKRSRSDMPPGASIQSDVEISSVDGSETELIIDDSDV